LFAACVVDTSGNLSPPHLPPVSLIPVVHLDSRISPRILEKFEMTQVLFSGAWGKMIHEKKSEAKNLVTLPL
jgi:hypothetical protein